MLQGALESLTATYTDSEGEFEDDEDGTRRSVNISPTFNPKETITTPASVNLTSNNVKQLVSYHDDLALSEDEGASSQQLKDIGSLTPPEPEPMTDDGIQLPPEPPGKCSQELQEKIQKLHDKMKKDGLDMNSVIQQRKDFRNPSIYEKLIQFCGINELGTNYPPNMYDPLRWGKESYYEELAKAQKHEMEKREKERRTKVEVVSGTRRSGSATEDDSKKRKSKWDQPSGNSLASHTLKPAGLIQPTLTSSATGTKGTVISAFGSLPRKPKI